MAESPATGSTTLAQLPDEVRAVVQAASAKKAMDIEVLDLRESAAFTDYFVICSGRTTRQVKAIVDGIEEALRNLKVKPAHIEGYTSAEWVLLDCFDFVVHVFMPHARTFYALERLWGRATRIEGAGTTGGQESSV